MKRLDEIREYWKNGFGPAHDDVKTLLSMVDVLREAHLKMLIVPGIENSPFKNIARAVLKRVDEMGEK